MRAASSTNAWHGRSSGQKRTNVSVRIRNSYTYSSIVRQYTLDRYLLLKRYIRGIRTLKIILTRCKYDVDHSEKTIGGLYSRRENYSETSQNTTPSCNNKAKPNQAIHITNTNDTFAYALITMTYSLPIMVSFLYLIRELCKAPFANTTNYGHD